MVIINVSHCRLSGIIVRHYDIRVISLSLQNLSGFIVVGIARYVHNDKLN